MLHKTQQTKSLIQENQLPSAKVALGFAIGLALSVFGTVLGSAVASSSYAQELEEIVVTATKRSESVQELALSVSVISGDELDARGATEFFDYAITVPNLSFGATDDGILSGRTISIRGIQGENTTGFYIDDTPISETIDPRILDLERIEVLRGPQGTLYGARSFGGTVRQITRKPDFSGLSGKFRVGFSLTDESDDINSLASFTANVPMADNAAVIFSGLWETRAGVYDRTFGTIDGGPTQLSASEPQTVFEDVDSGDTVAAQISFLWEPSDTLSIAPRIMYQKTTLDGFPLSDNEPDNFDQNRSTVADAPEGGEDEWSLFTFNINKDTGQGTFTAAFSYLDRETFEFEESGAFIDFLTEAFFLGGLLEVTEAPTVPALTQSELDAFADRLTEVSSPIYQRLESEFTTFEMRFASDLEGPVNYVVGAFYQEIEFVQAYDPRNIAPGLDTNLGVVNEARLLARNNIATAIGALTVGTDDAEIARLNALIAPTVMGNNPSPAGAFNAENDFPNYDDLIFSSYTPRDVEDLGLFAEVEWTPIDNLSFIFGARYYDISVDFLDYRGGLAAGPPLAPDADVRDTTPISDDTQAEDGTNLKFGIEYQATEDILLYTNIAEGFRIGGINEFTPATETSDPLGCLAEAEAAGLTEFNNPTYDSDSLISYELGLKTTVNNNTNINIGVFQVDISDIQQRFPFSCGFPLTANFGDATSSGIELEILTSPADGLTISFNTGLTDAEFAEDIGVNFIQEGDPLQQVPEFTASFSIDYWMPRSAGGDFFIRLDASFIDESVTRTNSSSDAATRQRDAYEQINLRMGYKRDAFTFSAYIKNLTNDIANLGDNRSLAAETPGRIRYVASRPMTIGMDVSYEF